MKAGNFPAVSFIKAPSYQDGHAGYSDPLDEQAAIVKLLNFLQARPEWKDTAVILDVGRLRRLVRSRRAEDREPVVRSPPISVTVTASAVRARRCPASGGKPVNGRCGPGTRIPFLVISPWAKINAVSHVPITQASVVRFIEDNWLHGQRLGGGSFDAGSGSIVDMFDFRASGGHAPVLLLDPRTGNPCPPTEADCRA